MGIVKYKAKTAKPIITPGLISEIGHTSDHSINKIVNAHEIPTEMVINIEQKILPFTLISKFFYFLFGCPTANLGHSQGDSLNNLMLITAFQLFQHEGHQEPPKYTLEKKSMSRVSVPGIADYLQITGSVTITGCFFKIQLIYHGKTMLSQPNYKFSKKFQVTQTANHWVNEATSIAFLEHFLVPYIETQMEELNSSSP